MRIELGEVEFTGEQEDDGTNGGEPAVAARLTFGRLEQSVDRFEETVGLAGLRPGDDAFEMVADHVGDLLHGLDLGAQHVSTPLAKQGAYDVDLFAVENLAQLFAVLPRPGGALDGQLGEQGIEFGPVLSTELSAILQQLPTQPLEAGVVFLFDTARLVDGRRGVRYHMGMGSRLYL